MITYASMHRLLRRTYGLATEHPCSAFCGAQARHWAYIGDGHADGMGAYSDDPGDFTPLCVRCHREVDGWDPVAARAARSRESLVAAGQARGRLAVESGRLAAISSKGGQATARMRQTCGECGMTTIPSNLSRHQRASGHTGVTTPEKETTP